MHRLAALAIVAAAAPATADVTPAPRLSFGLALAMHASHSGSLQEGGAGPNFELAFGRGRYQVFGELGVAVIGVDSGVGTSTRSGLGARILARTFNADEAAFDLVVEATLGGEYLSWSDGQRVRPVAAAGIGWQVRTRRGRKPFAVRVTTRMIATPTLDEPMAACLGTTCPAPERRTNFGFIGLFGVAW